MNVQLIKPDIYIYIFMHLYLAIIVFDVIKLTWTLGKKINGCDDNILIARWNENTIREKEKALLI